MIPNTINNTLQRDILWSQAPYPCVGEFKFLTLNLPSHPLYSQVLSCLSSSSSALLLDIGCCVAQELRGLAQAGISSSSLFGSDLNPHFLSTSYDLFLDRSTFNGILISADIFSPTLFTSAFDGWESKFTIVHAGLFLHLFSWEQQLSVCAIIVRLLKPEAGSLFLGEMVGCKGGGHRGGGKRSKVWKEEKREQYLHDVQTFEKIWGEVATLTDTVGKWKVGGTFQEREKAVDPTNGCAFFTGEGIG
jgi:hypothetical protein